MTKTYRWLLYDLDHTLFDFEKSEKEALNNFFTHICGRADKQMIETYHQINKAIWRRVELAEISVNEVNHLRIAETLKAIDCKYQAARAELVYLYFLSEAAYLFDGAYHLLESSSAKYQLAAITNGFTDVKKRHLEKSATAHFFNHLFISMEMGVSKPAPEYFKIALDKLQVDASECLIIGDNLHSDILGGINSGIDTCYFNPSGRIHHEILPTYQVENYLQLAKLLELDYA